MLLVMLVFMSWVFYALQSNGPAQKHLPHIPCVREAQFTVPRLQLGHISNSYTFGAATTVFSGLTQSQVTSRTHENYVPNIA